MAILIALAIRWLKLFPEQRDGAAESSSVLEGVHYVFTLWGFQLNNDSQNQLLAISEISRVGWGMLIV